MLWDVCFSLSNAPDVNIVSKEEKSEVNRESVKIGQQMLSLKKT